MLRLSPYLRVSYIVPSKLFKCSNVIIIHLVINVLLKYSDSTILWIVHCATNFELFSESGIWVWFSVIVGLPEEPSDKKNWKKKCFCGHTSDLKVQKSLILTILMASQLHIRYSDWKNNSIFEFYVLFHLRINGHIIFINILRVEIFRERKRQHTPYPWDLE